MSILIWLQTNLYKLGAVLGVVFAIYLKGRKSGSKSGPKYLNLGLNQDLHI